MIYVGIVCDNCGRLGDDDTGNRPPRVIRAGLKKAGWLVMQWASHGGKRTDYCPECAKTINMK